MVAFSKLVARILSGASDRNLAFSDLCGVLLRLGFDERVKGSHHIFYRTDIDEILNLQEKRGQAKPYQVKQVRDVIVKYRLARDSEDADEI